MCIRDREYTKMMQERKKSKTKPPIAKAPVYVKPEPKPPVVIPADIVGKTAIPVGANLLAQVEEVLKGYGWTVEESAVLFFMWCVACPERAKAWLAKCKNGEIQ